MKRRGLERGGGRGETEENVTGYSEWEEEETGGGGGGEGSRARNQGILCMGEGGGSDWPRHGREGHSSRRNQKPCRRQLHRTEDEDGADAGSDGYQPHRAELRSRELDPERKDQEDGAELRERLHLSNGPGGVTHQTSR